MTCTPPASFPGSFCMTWGETPNGSSSHIWMILLPRGWIATSQVFASSPTGSCAPVSFTVDTVRLSQKSHKVAVLLGIILLSALSFPDRREGGSGGSQYRRPLELSSGGSKFP